MYGVVMTPVGSKPAMRLARDPVSTTHGELQSALN